MMEDEIGHETSHAWGEDPRDFTPARFPSKLGLPPAEAALLEDAAKAVEQEYHDCSKWKKLSCRKVSVFSERDRGTVYVVHVGRSVEFDWTWEGAVAFRPLSLDKTSLLDDFEDVAYKDQIFWSGEILEVDEQEGCLFLCLSDPECPPTTGAFFVRPFEFLAVLNAVYRDPRFAAVRSELPARLAAAAGQVHPPIENPSENPSPVGQPYLKKWWQHAWSILWGPPGTGKTYTTGQQVAAVLQDRSERILVVSTTNRATDAAALAIGNAAKTACPRELNSGRLLRIGKGASYQAFQNHALDAMLRGTEAESLSRIDSLVRQLPLFDSREDKALTRKQIGELRAGGSEQSRRAFLDSEVRVVVSTAFKAMSFLNDDLISRMVEGGGAPFTTVIIDEAGLISRAAVAALSLLASRRVVLVGDSKQLAPISRISRILPTRQETWLASSGVSHLDDIESNPPAVHVLLEQRRMHPAVCRVVSDFQYEGLLNTADETANRKSKLPAFIADHSRTIWYVLDAENVDLASLRAQRGPGNRSWIRPATSLVLEKLFSDTDVRSANGLFITPYKAQAHAVSQWLASQGIDSWEASTVHSQQGSEADIVVFDTVHAGNCTWPFDEWKRLVNVALSRSREAVLVLASRDEMEEPYLRPLLRLLTPSVLRASADATRWETLAGESDRVEKVTARLSPRSSPPAGQPGRTLGDQLGHRKQLRPVLSHEQQRLSNLEPDGKPRLVRGVAGSGKSLVLCKWLAKIAQRTRDVKDFRIWAVYANRSLQKLLRQSIEAAWRESSDSRLFDAEDFPWQNVSLLHVKDVLAGILPAAGLSIDEFNFDYDRAAEEFLNRQDANELLPRCNALFIDEAQDMGPSTLRLLLSIVEQADLEDPNSRSAHIFYDNAQNIYGRRTPRWSEFGLDMRGRSTIMKESFRSTNPISEFAVNLLHRLSPSTLRQDLAELTSLGLLERTERDGREWLSVRYNQVSGPKPVFRKYTSVAQELQAIASHLNHLIVKEDIAPEDICLIYNGPQAVQLLKSRLAPAMADIGVELSVQTSRAFQRQPNTLLVTTSHSFKGYEAEVVMIPCADHYVTSDNQILANNLYVAMTRARSLLAIYSLDKPDAAVQKLNAAFEFCSGN